MIAILAGATGLTGKQLLQELESSDEISQIYTIGRRQSETKRTSKTKEILLKDEEFSRLSKSEDPRLSGELYFCALGTTIRKAGSRAQFRHIDYDLCLEFGKLCEARGGKSFALVSASGANPSSPIFYSRTKGELEKSILALQIPQITIARPALLLGERAEPRFLENLGRVFLSKFGPLLPEALSHRLGTPVSNLAKVLIEESLQLNGQRKTLEASDLVKRS